MWPELKWNRTVAVTGRKGWKLMKERRSRGERGLRAAASKEGLIENCKREIQQQRLADGRNREHEQTDKKRFLSAGRMSPQ